MKKYPIRLLGDPVLRAVAQEITEFDESLEEFAGDMVAAMIEGDGIGLAAPQVGVSKRFIVIGMPVKNEDDTTTRKIYVMVNPEIIEESEDETEIEEGCLSIPDIAENVYRPQFVKIRYQDLKGEWQEVEAGEMLSRVFQHENDHLNGVLFIDHLSSLKRRLLKGKLRRIEERSRELRKELGEL